MFYVYILRSLKTGEFYKGLTSNLDQRFKDHLAGKTKSTKFRLPFELIHVEICSTREEARKREIIKEISRSQINNV